MNGHAANGVLAPPSQQPVKGAHLEPSILNQIPSDEVIKAISDFLFVQVMQNQDTGVSPAGGPTGQGAVLEIEAKIGRLVDYTTNQRIYLPVRTEAIFDRNNPSLRTRFESSMTEVRTSQVCSLAMIMTRLVATSCTQRLPEPGAHCYSGSEADTPKAEAATKSSY